MLLLLQVVERRTLWFVYSGMGSQWAGTGAGLMPLPAFRDTIERLHAVLLPRGLHLKDIITDTGPTAFDDILKSFVGITACQVLSASSAVCIEHVLTVRRAAGMWLVVRFHCMFIRKLEMSMRTYQGVIGTSSLGFGGRYVTFRRKRFISGLSNNNTW